MDFSMRISYLLFPQNGCYAVTCRALLSDRDHFVHVKQCSFVTFTRFSGLIIWWKTSGQKRPTVFSHCAKIRETFRSSIRQEPAWSCPPELLLPRLLSSIFIGVPFSGTRCRVRSEKNLVVALGMWSFKVSYNTVRFCRVYNKILWDPNSQHPSRKSSVREPGRKTLMRKGSSTWPCSAARRSAAWISIAISGSQIAMSGSPGLGWWVEGSCGCWWRIGAVAVIRSHMLRGGWEMGIAIVLWMADLGHYCGGSLRLGLCERSEMGGRCCGVRSMICCLEVRSGDYEREDCSAIDHVSSANLTSLAEWGL